MVLVPKLSAMQLTSTNMQITVTIQGTINETAITKIPESTATKELAKTWFSQSEPPWFERDDIFHGSGVILDKKTKVVVKSEGKKLDSFKLVDCPELFNVISASGNDSDLQFAGVLAMENSDGTLTLHGEMEDYERSKLSFEVIRLGVIDVFSSNPCLMSAEYYIVTSITGFTSEGVDSANARPSVMVSKGIPFKSPKEQTYNAGAAAKFRKNFLS